VLEVLLDRNAHSALAFSGLLLWALVYVCDMLWAQLKVDATLGHTIMGTLGDSSKQKQQCIGVKPTAVDMQCPVLRAEPNFLFHARELTDLEATLSPSSRALLTAALPALPVLVVGLVSLEAKDLVSVAGRARSAQCVVVSCWTRQGSTQLEVVSCEPPYARLVSCAQVDHEPSVPTLEALLLSCIAFAAQHNLTAVMAGSSTLNRSHMLLLQAAAAAVAVVLELVVSRAWTRGAVAVNTSPAAVRRLEVICWSWYDAAIYLATLCVQSAVLLPLLLLVPAVVACCCRSAPLLAAGVCLEWRSA
jgi:hypothetical protein